jgi:protein-tyrosine phosphatase
MRSDVYWIDWPARGRLAIMARPRASDWLEDEIAGWKEAGIATVVCLLDQDEVAELGLREEAELCRRYDIEFISFPIEDRGVPGSTRDAQMLSQRIASTMIDGANVAIHCRAGIGRSGVIAACTLICLGSEAAAALDLISKVRGVRVPDTDAQRDWVVAFEQAAIITR